MKHLYTMFSHKQFIYSFIFIVSLFSFQSIRASQPDSPTVSKELAECPDAKIIAGADIFCEGIGVQLIANGGTRFKWNTGDTTQMINIKAGGSYSVEITWENNCQSTSPIKVITMIPAPTIVISGDTTICEKDSTQITLTGNATTYTLADSEWLPNTSKYFSPSQTSLYTINASYTFGGLTCNSSKKFTIQVSDKPKIEIIGSQNICKNDSTLLLATGAHSYLWSTGENKSSIYAKEEKTYSLYGFSKEGCYDSASITMYKRENPNVTILGDSIICLGEQAELTGVGATSYLWNTGIANTSIIPDTSGLYMVTGTNEYGCSDTDSINITVNPLPVIYLLSDTTICANDTLQLQASGEGDLLFEWINESVSGNLLHVTQSGTYTVKGTELKENGCSAIASSNVTVNPIPLPEITGKEFVCPSESVTITATGGDKYYWLTTGDTTASIHVAATSIGTLPAKKTYIVQAANQYNCQNTTSITITVAPLPNIKITGKEYFCDGAYTVLTAHGGTSFKWSTNSVQDTIWVSQAGTYEVTTTNGLGCSNKSSISITSRNNPVVQISGKNTICKGESTTLEATGGLDYQWGNSSDKTAKITVVPDTTTIYPVLVTDQYGCQTSSSITVTVLPIPILTISGEKTFCENTENRLTASGAERYEWNSGANTADIIITTPGTYTVVAYLDNQCSVSDSITVSMLPAPEAIITGEAFFCNGEENILYASGGIAYLWNTGESTDSIVISTDGIFHVTITDEAGCSDYAEIYIELLEAPTYSVSGNMEICEGSTTILKVESEHSYQYEWNTGAKTSSITVSPEESTSYIVNISNQNCEINEEICVVVNSVLVHRITDNICQGKVYKKNGFSTDTLETPGMYDLKLHLSSSHGCDSIVELRLNVNPLPTPTAIPIIGQSAIIVTGSYTYSAALHYANAYQWSIDNPKWEVVSTGTQYATLNVNSTGSGILTLIGVNECGFSEEINLSINSNVGIDNNQMQHISIFPNPTTDYISIKNENPLYSTLLCELFDMNGRIVKQERIENIGIIHLDDLSKGQYFLRFFSGSELLGSSKIIKQ